MPRIDIERFDNAFPDGVFAFLAPTEAQKSENKSVGQLL
jgi:hypothetical protein